MAHPFMHPKTYLSDGKRMNEIIMFELQELVSSLTKVQNQSVESRLFLNITTANIFYQYICSKRFSEDDPTFLKTVHTYDAVFRQLFQGYAIDFMPWLKIFERNASKLRELRDQAREVSKVTEAIFREHTSNPDSPDLIDIYLNYLQENEVAGTSSLTREEVEVIIEDLIGGHSVLGNLWLWGLYFLAANPEVSRNIREEVARVTCGLRAPTYEDKKQMPYTDAAAYEILRIVSSPIIPHVATTDTSISGYEVHKNTMVMFNTNDMNMDPQYWHEPLKFNPM
ncbi:Cytochrome P450 307a1, partial [Araneus ventricosus]